MSCMNPEMKTITYRKARLLHAKNQYSYNRENRNGPSEERKGNKRLSLIDARDQMSYHQNVSGTRNE